MKFVLLGEGPTEKKSIANFIKRWLDCRLSQRIGIKPVNLTGFDDFKKNASKKAHMHLNGSEKDQIIAVIGLLDLYGPQSSDFYPPDKTSIEQRYEWGVSYFQTEVNNPKFHMFFAVHEYEAWLFSQKEIFPAAIKSLLPDKTPESINFNKPPATLLGELYRRAYRNKGYKKVVDGPRLFKKLDPSVAYDKCPHLRVMLDEMLKLAQNAGL
jgi:hypothetical protein